MAEDIQSPTATQTRVYAEPIRLVIWDLDETFWTGTLTEGGITYRQDCHDLVVTLAKRGIISSICSKNELADVKAVLEASGLWEYFVFPSINWRPKGPRVKSIIEEMGLRAPTVLFIDDNPQNLFQAASESPGLNIATPDDILSLLTHPQCAGKDDSELTRLAQYKVLEQKQVLKEESGGDNISFLRSSNIRVFFDYDTVGNIDRVIELVNRTNQLNFTKLRVPDDIEEARKALIPFLQHPGTTSGLIRVVDDFGDYGYVGFYAFTELSAKFYLKHFCFSCRTLNMYIEHFVYDFIGRPNLEVVGEVLSDIQSNDVKVDWITALPIDQLEVTGDDNVKKIEKMFVRGGCDLMSLCHYFGMNCRDITTEFNDLWNWQPRRIDHSNYLYYALTGLNEAQLRAAAGLGYEPRDFTSAFPREGVPVYMLSFWADVDIALYRHRETGVELPWALTGSNRSDLIADIALGDRIANRPCHFDRLAILRRDWEYVGTMTPERMIERYRFFLSQIPATSQVFITLANYRPPEHFFQEHKPVNTYHQDYNRVMRQLATEYPNIGLVDPGVYVHCREDLLDINHFRRDIYHQIYLDILKQIV